MVRMAKSRKSILLDLRESLASLPERPGVYLFKDAAGVVLYVGKAKNLRSRVSSYFQEGARLMDSRGPEIDRMVRELVCDVDVLDCESEVDAVLLESRLIKDIQPRFNARQKDDKSFPYLQIRTGEDFPRVQITREPASRGVKLYGPFVSPRDLRNALPLMQRVFRFRTCKLDIQEHDPQRRFFRPCILYSIRQCSGPCGARIEREEYLQRIRRFRQFLESKGTQLKRELTEQMQQAARQLQFERAAQLRDELQALEGLQKRGLASEHLQPEVFNVDFNEGMERLGSILNCAQTPRTIEGIDIAHLDGGQQCGSLVVFIDGKPHKGGYRRFRIKTVQGSDDFAAIREVVYRRYRHAGMNEGLFPDVILIDGGRGQLSAAMGAFEGLEFLPPRLISLAKREEEIFLPGRDRPLKLSRHDPALRILQAVRDEAHRFAQHYHHILRRRATFGEDPPTGSADPSSYRPDGLADVPPDFEPDYESDVDVDEHDE
jgi:excinuclease ABC subunit C